MERLLYLIPLLLCMGTARAQQPDNYKSHLRDATVKIGSTNLPIVFVDVNNAEILKDRYILAKMKIVYNGEGCTTYGDTIAHPGQAVDYEGYIALKYRGSSSFYASDKKPYGFRTLKTNVLPADGGKKDKVRILGMGKDNRWAILAPWCDRSMMRDLLTFELARPWSGYAPHARFCELVLDGTYYGVYLITERVSEGKNRLDLDDPGTHEGDLTGDYLVEINRDDDPHYVSKYHPWASLSGEEEPYKTVKYQYVFPEEEDFPALPAGTEAALQAELDKMESSFTGDNYTDKNTGYRSRIDVTSFIDYMLATELSMNIDGYRLSTNLYKHGEARARKEGLDPRWKTALWDFNIAYGNANYYQGTSTNLWQYLFNQRNPGDSEHVPFYWYKMLNDTSYVGEMKARWAAYRQGSYSNGRIFAKIDSLAGLITSGGAANRNEQAWQIFSRSYIWPCPYYPSDYTAEITYLKSWIAKRLAFIDKNFLPQGNDEQPQVGNTLPVAVNSGWNADVIAEGTPVGKYYDKGIDGNMCYYTTGVSEEGGLPANGLLVSPAKTNYKLEYEGLSALHMDQAGMSREIGFEEVFNTDSIFFLAASGNGQSTLQVVVNYADGSQSVELQTYYVNDWSQRNPTGTEAAYGLGRAQDRGGTDYISSGDGCHFVIYENAIETDKRKPVKSVTITHVSGGSSNVLAFSRKAGTSTGMRPADTPPGEAVATGIYTINGIKLDKMRKGVNIIRYPDGTTRKVVVM